MLLVLVASTQIAQAKTDAHRSASSGARTGTDVTATVAPAEFPTVVVPNGTAASIPTLGIPRPTYTPTATPRPVVKHRKPRARRHQRVVAAPRYQWITAFLTSYCPGSAGWLASSGRPVFYGMLANDFYAYGTRVYIPVIGLTGVVADRVGAFATWNHFDVWSPVCYSTPTGWFRVAIVLR